jgi:hypothetical protein
MGELGGPGAELGVIGFGRSVGGAWVHAGEFGIGQLSVARENFWYYGLFSGRDPPPFTRLPCPRPPRGWAIPRRPRYVSDAPAQETARDS